MDVGTGCAVIGGAASFAAIAISGVHGYFESKKPVVFKGDEYNANLCKKEHESVNQKLDRAEKDRTEMTNTQARDTTALFVVLGRIEKKIDDHVNFHLTLKMRKGDSSQ